ncbi:MAG: UvrB/UvrC motif-containing protein [Kiritimatiellae bacterium]|jgi:protein arginine kinase activator|nr:UvrB/UvrC motif-containing protein [Kiritimatiellia bacterium]
MKCDKCDKPATVHLTQVINGKMQKLHLCESCAEEAGVGHGATFSMSDLLLGQGVAQPLAQTGRSRSCPECGWTLHRLRKVGRFGCPACYQSFEKEVIGLLKSIHHATEHVGRHPRNRVKKLSMRNRIESLESSISEAVAAEEYEKAAEYRDELKALQDSSREEETSHDH